MTEKKAFLKLEEHTLKQSQFLMLHYYKATVRCCMTQKIVQKYRKSMKIVEMIAVRVKVANLTAHNHKKYKKRNIL